MVAQYIILPNHDIWRIIALFAASVKCGQKSYLKLYQWKTSLLASTRYYPSTGCLWSNNVMTKEVRFVCLVIHAKRNSVLYWRQGDDEL